MARLGTWVLHEFLPRIPHNEWREPGKFILSSFIIHVSCNIQYIASDVTIWTYLRNTGHYPPTLE